jgi:rod shape-determining protein MreD
MMIVKPQDPRRIDLRGMLPALLVLAVVVLTHISLDVTAIQRAMPLWAGGLVFYWGLYRPDLMPLALCLVAGLAQDAMSGVPLGVHGLGFVLLRQMASGQQQFLHGRAFHMVWLFFAVAFCLWSIIEGFILSLLGYPFGTAPLVRYGSTVLAFPVIYAGAGWFQHRFLRQRRRR